MKMLSSLKNEKYDSYIFYNGKKILSIMYSFFFLISSQFFQGFIKLALETGSPVVPVYCFGERRAYHNFSNGISTFLKKLLNIGLPFVHGLWFTLMPYATPLTIVIGQPIEVPTFWSSKKRTSLHHPVGGEPESGNDSPDSISVTETSKSLVPLSPTNSLSIATSLDISAAAGKLTLDEAVDKVHAMFMNNLVDLYENHKEAAGYGNIQLVIR
jgi:Diacylglycerol acyltransferase